MTILAWKLVPVNYSVFSRKASIGMKIKMSLMLINTIRGFSAFYNSCREVCWNLALLQQTYTFKLWCFIINFVIVRYYGSEHFL